MSVCAARAERIRGSVGYITAVNHTSLPKNGDDAPHRARDAASPEAAFTTPPKAPKRTPDSFDSQEHRNAFAYVMVVKNATSHDTYRAFLEALHTYQKNAARTSRAWCAASRSVPGPRGFIKGLRALPAV